MLPEKLLASPNLWTDEAKKWKWADFPGKQTCLSKTSGCISFSKVSLDFFENLTKQTGMSNVAFGPLQRKFIGRNCQKRIVV